MAGLTLAAGLAEIRNRQEGAEDRPSKAVSGY